MSVEKKCSPQISTNAKEYANMGNRAVNSLMRLFKAELELGQLWR
jgi:hypothetical protein